MMVASSARLPLPEGRLPHRRTTVVTAAVIAVGRVEADQGMNVRDEPGLQFDDFDEANPHRIRVGARGASALGAGCGAG